MSHRMNPQEYGVSKHIVERGYLTDLQRDLAADYYQWTHAGQPHQGWDGERLAAWALVHRSNLAGCKGFGKRGFTDHLHEDDLEFIDTLIESVKRGVAEGDSAKYISTRELEQLDTFCDRLLVCSDQIVWYR